jgi:hypothetical protein
MLHLVSDDGERIVRHVRLRALQVGETIDLQDREWRITEVIASNDGVFRDAIAFAVPAVAGEDAVTG